MPGENIIMLQTVANGLGALKDEMVFVGGAVAELYADNPAASEIRPTLDVDCVIEIRSRLQFAKMEENLRAKGFKNDTSKGALICRWIYKDIKVDVMPTDSSVLGFSNRWYEVGIEIKYQKRSLMELKFLYFRQNIIWLQNLKRTMPEAEMIYGKATILRISFTF